MQYYSIYNATIGKMILFSNGSAITGLYFSEEIPQPVPAVYAPNLPILLDCKNWLDAYFSGNNPDMHTLPLNPKGTDFQKLVWKELTKIPYGTSSSYGEIAKAVAAQMGKEKMSAQAVGGAIGKNPISIMIPCHRVLGADGSLTGYAGGLDKKIKLLNLEGIHHK